MSNNIILFFGNQLAEALGKKNKSGAICGFIRLALKAEFGEDGVKKITADKLKKAFQGDLSEKLKILNIENMDQIMSKMVKNIDMNQSLFTMSGT